MAGGQHHHRTNLDKYHPGYFGKVGMRYFHKIKAHFWKPVINLDKVRLSILVAWVANRRGGRCSSRKSASPGEARLSRRSPLIEVRSAERRHERGTCRDAIADTVMRQLWALIPQEKRDHYIANKKSDTAPVLDLLPLGYSKVLGKGRLPEIPIVVRARYFSALAEKKIKEAGGVTELVA